MEHGITATYPDSAPSSSRGPRAHPLVGARRRLPRARRGFTLIELLVVVAIIALLLSILMSSLSRVRASARHFVCQNNLRTVAFDFTLFADDPVDSGAGRKEGGGGGRFRLETFQEKVYRINDFWDAPGKQTEWYDPDKQPLMCPSASDQLRRIADRPCRDYAVAPPENVSVAFNARLDRISMKIQDRWVLMEVQLGARILEHPSVPLAFDADGAEAVRKLVVPYYSTPPSGDEGRYGTGQFWFPSMRHEGKLTAAFVGGYVLSTREPTRESGWDWSYQPPAE